MVDSPFFPIFYPRFRLPRFPQLTHPPVSPSESWINPLNWYLLTLSRKLSRIFGTHSLGVPF